MRLWDSEVSFFDEKTKEYRKNKKIREKVLTG